MKGLLFEEMPCEIDLAVEELAMSGEKERGAIHTKPEVVSFILDLVGYTSENDLSQSRLLEPSCGDGAFVVEAVERLLSSYFNRQQKQEDVVVRLRDAIRAVELFRPSFESARARIEAVLGEYNISREKRQELLGHWFVNEDFLLASFPMRFTHVVGNPPYVRQELIPEVLLQEYRRRFHTIYDRADLYIPFIEKGLRLLAEGGTLGYICSDRWLKNKYGGPLRRYIAANYRLACYVDMVDTPAFTGEVSAYPGVFILKRGEKGVTRIARRPLIEHAVLKPLARSLFDGSPYNGNVPIGELDSLGNTWDPWLLEAPDELSLLRRIEREHNVLEEEGCTVGIGVATGADRVFIGTDENLPVEEERRLPILLARDIRTGRPAWSGNYVLNPFNEDGSLARLEDFPKFARYLLSHEPIIKGRNVAGRNSPERWYRTIDRIYPALTTTEKLLIPDIKGTANVVYDDGQYYPHHNLYYITSQKWDLRALQALLRSSVTEFFIGMYSVKMRGGYLRYQAQYLRRIRLPSWDKVKADDRTLLARLAEDGSREEIDAIAYDIYGMNRAEIEMVKRVVYNGQEDL